MPRPDICESVTRRQSVIGLAAVH